MKGDRPEGDFFIVCNEGNGETLWVKNAKIFRKNTRACRINTCNFANE